ncbi:aldo/keto reductase [Pseudomonas typographi]|uniref:Aldo/keto reductase n=1 Tax=Pseudomonas typographi TaxID=2715964 RepID=A0ABR7Z8Y3_9PSED|nr:aldo/keto reductase [Pseudomonas typographi]MBD1554843.1 aldo/keto reductase [Pseudomonas typographi]MBD1589882.1 aldo/keto reductase [Pseudomonas typographi]MBD1601890.1 aldo/keto reductase [Pseudomonas typographi]
MHYRNLGRSGLKVSPLNLGSMMFGDQTDEATSRRIIDSAFARGVNFVDTANVYNKGESERIVGRAIAAQRHAWVLATKAGSPTGQQSPLPHNVGASRKHLLYSAEQSLQRLGTDYIDLFYLHREDHDTALEETVSALGDLIRQGKVRYWGVSNHRGWKIAELVNVARRLNVDAPIAVQPLYNIVNRQAEQEVFTAAAYHGLGIVPYSPLARGVLTGKYAPDQAPAADTRAGRQDKRIQETEWRPESLAIAQQVAAYAKDRGTTPTAFAIAWVLHNPLVTSAIVGPRTEAHWEGYLPALDYHVTAEDEAFIDSLVVPGHASTPGFNDPAHFFSGRPVV